MRRIERNDERGTSDLGWLLSRFSYSFAEYENPSRMGFGALRVVNDDTIAPQKGFPLHHHEQMEIVTIMLEGTLTHHDTLGNTKDLREGEVQTMTAGTGVSHGEWNNDKTTPAKLLQVWMYPKERSLVPRYTQMKFDESDRHNIFQILACGEHRDGTLFVHQDVILARVSIEGGRSASYTLANPTHGVFVFVVSGKVEIGTDVLSSRDAMEVTQEEKLTFYAQERSDVVVIEVPMG